MPLGYTIALYRPRLGPVAPRVIQYRIKREAPEKAVASIGRALRIGDYEVMMKLVGEAKFLPNHMLRFNEHYVAIERDSGLAWRTDPTGGEAIGSIFSLLGYAELEGRFTDPDARVRVRLALPPNANCDAMSLALAKISAIRIDAPTVDATVNRATMVALLFAILDGLDRDPANAPKPDEYRIQVCDPAAILVGEPA